MSSNPSFYSPQFTLWVVWLMWAALPLLLKQNGDIRQVIIAPSDLERLRPLMAEPLLLLPNHPTADDPLVILELAKRLNMPFHAVVAREAFDLDGGWRGKLFRRLGGYSIVRGAVDRESFKTSKGILTEGKRPLVIFIEGEISRENAALIPFEPGVVHLAMTAQQQLVKADPNTAKPVRLLPLAISYQYLPGVEKTLRRSLARLESAVGIDPPGTNGDRWVERIQAIGQRVLAVQERLLSLSPDPGQPMGERIEAVKLARLEALEHWLALPPPAPSNSSYLDRIRTVRNEMDHRVYAYQEPEGLCPYERRLLAHELRQRFKAFYRDLDLLVQFMMMREGYLSANASLERCVEVVHRLEAEVLGAVMLKHPKVATLSVGDPVDLREHATAFAANRRQTLDHLVQGLQDQMQALLLLKR
jgi:1-acyl-sn-glycerol-3-phosphate acyltransferase